MRYNNTDAVPIKDNKSKGCEYCKGRAYTKRPLTIITKYGRRIELVFEFCPNCGSKMERSNENAE